MGEKATTLFAVSSINTSLAFRTQLCSTADRYEESNFSSIACELAAPPSVCTSQQLLVDVTLEYSTSQRRAWIIRLIMHRMLQPETLHYYAPSKPSATPCVSKHEYKNNKALTAPVLLRHIFSASAILYLKHKSLVFKTTDRQEILNRRKLDQQPELQGWMSAYECPTTLPETSMHQPRLADNLSSTPASNRYASLKANHLSNSQQNSLLAFDLRDFLFLLGSLLVQLADGHVLTWGTS